MMSCSSRRTLLALGAPTGQVRGKDELRAYWASGLEQVIHDLCLSSAPFSSAVEGQGWRNHAAVGGEER